MICAAVVLAAAVQLVSTNVIPSTEPTTTAVPGVGRSERCLHGPFQRITRTNEIGEIIGPADPNDWGCLGGSPPHGSGGRKTIGLEDVPVPPPTHLCLNEAFPNPASSATTIGMTLPEATHLSLAIYAEAERGRGRDAIVIRTLFDGDFRAGSYTVIWNLTDDHGTRVRSGVYRAVLTTAAGILCGDIEVP